MVHDVKLNQIEHVRECVKRRNKISFCMVPCSAVALEDVVNAIMKNVNRSTDLNYLLFSQQRNLQMD